MKKVTIENVKARIDDLEDIKANTNIGISLREEFELECLRKLFDLLALRERAEPVAVPDLHKVIYHFRDLNEGFPVERFKADYVIAWMLANYPPAPIVTDALELFAEFMEAESIKAGDYPEGWRCKAANAAYDYVRACIAETLNGAEPVAETDTTSQQFESLATSAGSGKHGQ